jgi:uncharacterized protein DUF4838/glycosyl hydrolase family 67
MRNSLQRVLPVALLAGCLVASPLAAAEVVLARGGATPYQLYMAGATDEVTAFAGAELQKYLARITGASLQTASEAPDGNVFAVGLSAARKLGVDPSEQTTHEDGFVTVVEAGRVVLAGNTPRATLYAVYDFLEDLGCRWMAPNFDYPGLSRGEYVPGKPDLTLPAGRSVDEPSFRFRYKRVEEGHSHDPERLRQLVDWMAKVKLNAFNCPIDYNNLGRSTWDKWRAELTPELRKRGILIDVGGHGYENFLPPEKYAAEHPEWYGTLNGERMADMKRVNFNTANQAAVAVFIENIKEFLRARPEIEIFSLVPPDTPHWDESLESRRLGSIPDRHALLVNQVAAALKTEFPRLRLVIPAYQALVRPPESVSFEDDVILGFAAIRRDNSKPMSDLSEGKNSYYVNYLWQWLDSEVFAGDILFLGYYYRYAWRSLPVVNYGVMAQDLKFLRANGVAGGGSYSEPGNWFTYELTHYLLAKMLWDHRAPVETLIADYCEHRFGPAAEPMQELFALLESFTTHVVRGFGLYADFDSDMPFPELGVQGIVMQPFAAYRRQVGLSQKLLSEALQRSEGNPEAKARIEKWRLLLRYLELEIQAKYFAGILASGSPYGPVLERLQAVYGQMDSLMKENADAGVFLTEDPRSDYSNKPAPQN